MRSYFKFRMLNRDNYVLVGSVPALVKLERDNGLRFEPTGLNNDSFGRGMIERYANMTGNNIWEFADLKKYLKWNKSINK